MKTLIAIYAPFTLLSVSTMLTMTLSIGFLVLIIISFIDLLARYREFLAIKKNWKRGHVRLMKSSRCQRGVAIAASPNMRDCRMHYHKMGYRWFHFLPDNTFSKRSPFLKLKFYMGVIGLKLKKER